MSVRGVDCQESSSMARVSVSHVVMRSPAGRRYRVPVPLPRSLHAAAMILIIMIAAASARRLPRMPDGHARLAHAGDPHACATHAMTAVPQLDSHAAANAMGGVPM